MQAFRAQPLPSSLQSLPVTKYRKAFHIAHYLIQTGLMSILIDSINFRLNSQMPHDNEQKALLLSARSRNLSRYEQSSDRVLEKIGG